MDRMTQTSGMDGCLIVKSSDYATVVSSPSLFRFIRFSHAGHDWWRDRYRPLASLLRFGRLGTEI
jgi:hypothetical protein